MKTGYKEPKMRVSRFETEDILTASETEQDGLTSTKTVDINTITNPNKQSVEYAEFIMEFK